MRQFVAAIPRLALTALLGLTGCASDVGSAGANLRVEVDGDVLCVGPAPSGCRSSGCPRGFSCEADVGCRPSSCSCDNGIWLCTADCGGGYCVPDALEEIDPRCDASEPLSCAGVTECGPLLCPPGTSGCNCACGNRACVPDGTNCSDVCTADPHVDTAPMPDPDRWVDALEPVVTTPELEPDVSYCGDLVCPPGTAGCNCACGNRACLPVGTSCLAVCSPEPTDAGEDLVDAVDVSLSVPPGA